MTAGSRKETAVRGHSAKSAGGRLELNTQAHFALLLLNVHGGEMAY